jgi:hypothetical protein
VRLGGFGWPGLLRKRSLPAGWQSVKTFQAIGVDPSKIIKKSLAGSAASRLTFRPT